MDQSISQVISDVDLFTGGRLVHGSLTIDGEGRIARIDVTSDRPQGGRFVLPGCIDAHVHFREPGLTHKADIATESRAAAAGGVTYVLDMPNVVPTTTTPEALAQKHQLFREKCVVNYGLWYGITAQNVNQALADYGRPDSPHRDEICGFKVFLGSSTGGMLMNDQTRLRQLFACTQRVIGIHSESEDVIRRNVAKYLALHPGDDLPIEFHPRIRDVEACLDTTRLAIGLALQTGAQLHICHLTTADELLYATHMAPDAAHITLEACVAHLWFSQEDYRRLGTRIKCNPAIKRRQDRDALRNALDDGRLFSVATDHAPHLMQDKQGGALRAASGMPSVQYSLLAMLELMRQRYLSLPRLVELMATHPAQRFGLTGRGLIAEGCHADLVMVDPGATTLVDRAGILSKCGWSPFEGTTFSHRIVGTWVNGRRVFGQRTTDNGQ